jgi:hypothetical protein
MDLHGLFQGHLYIIFTFFLTGPRKRIFLSPHALFFVNEINIRVLKMVVGWIFISEDAGLTTRMKQEFSYEALSLIYQIKKLHVTENHKLHVQCSEKVKPH